MTTTLLCAGPGHCLRVAMAWYASVWHFALGADKRASQNAKRTPTNTATPNFMNQEEMATTISPITTDEQPSLAQLSRSHKHCLCLGPGLVALGVTPHCGRQRQLVAGLGQG